MKVASFTDHVYTPSSRFRIRQYIPALAARDIHVRDFCRRYSSETAADPAGRRRIRHNVDLIALAAVHEARNLFQRLLDVIASNNCEAVWLSRQLIVGYPSFEWLIRKPLIYDIDDAIFLNSKPSYRQFRVAAERACTVVAGNSFLADAAAKHNARVRIVPTGVDVQRWHPSRDVRACYLARSEDFRIGWTGTSSAFRFLIPLQDVLKRFVREFPASRLLIMADRFPHELPDLAPAVEFVKWHQDSEVEFVQSLDVGLMPIGNEPWCRGKCAYKLLLYSACGVPAVVSPFGANRDVLAEADVGLGPESPQGWYEALEFLYRNRSAGETKGRNGVALVTSRYSTAALAPLIADILLAAR